jgi:hypothetical protein
MAGHGILMIFSTLLAGLVRWAQLLAGWESRPGQAIKFNVAGTGEGWARAHRPSAPRHEGHRCRRDAGNQVAATKGSHARLDRRGRRLAPTFCSPSRMTLHMAEDAVVCNDDEGRINLSPRYQRVKAQR